METEVNRGAGGCRRRHWVSAALRLALGGVFLWAGVLKAMAPTALLADVENYRILPDLPSVLIALYLPYLEIVCGLALWCRRLERGAVALMGAMMAVFVIALASAWLRGLDIECGCFGSGGGHAAYGMTLGRDVAILAALAFLWKSPTAPGFGASRSSAHFLSS